MSTDDLPERARAWIETGEANADSDDYVIGPRDLAAFARAALEAATS